MRLRSMKFSLQPRERESITGDLVASQKMIQSEAKQQIYFLLSQLLEYKVIISISKDSSHKRYKINLVK